MNINCAIGWRLIGPAICLAAAAGASGAEIDTNQETGHFRRLGTNDGVESKGSDDFEWYIPLHVAPRDFWSEQAREGKTTYRAIRKAESPGQRALIEASAFLADGQGSPKHPVFVEIDFKDVLSAPAQFSAWSGEDGGFAKISEFGGKADNQWKTVEIEAAPGKLKMDSKQNYSFAIGADKEQALPISAVKVFMKVPPPEGPEAANASLSDLLGFEARSFWTIRHFPPDNHDYETVFDTEVKHKGKQSLRIKLLQKESPGSWGGCFTPKNLEVKGNTNYKLTLFARAENLRSARLNCYMVGQKNKKMEILKIRDGTYDWNPCEFVFRTPAATGQVRLYCQHHGTGTVWLDDLRLEELGADEAETIVYGETAYIHRPRREKQDPPLAGELKQRHGEQGYIPYIRKNIRGYYPDSIPQPEEAGYEISAFAAPGQYAAAWFMVYGLKDIKALSIALDGDLKNAAGDSIGKDAVRVKHVKCWPQRCSERGSGYYVIPELLENFDKIDVAAETTEGFWLQVKIPAQTEPGIYRAELRIAPSNLPPATMIFRLEVMPFDLEQPDGIDWVMYSNLMERYRGGIYERPWTGHHYTEAELRRYLDDMKEYGITGIWDMPWDSNRLEGDKRVYNEFENAARTARLFKETGFTGPLILFLNPENVILDKKRGKNMPDFLFDEMKDPAFQNEFKEYLKTIDLIVGMAGVTNWYFQGTDEPHQNGADSDKMRKTLWELKLARAAGVKTFMTVYPLDAAEKLFPYLNVDANSILANTGNDCRKFTQLANRHNVDLCYIGAGVYGIQEGGLLPNRYLAGFLFYKTGARAHISWSWQYIKGTPWIDWDESDMRAAPKNSIIAYPARNITSNEATISTLQWEGIREGIDDYKYIHTLKQWILRAREKEREKETAAAEKMLADLLNEMPWGADAQTGNCYLAPGNVTDETANAARRRIADEIIKLKQLVK
ncbi:MAG: hypothetical protein PHP98_06895 [Kiritimatiellae bacterium]|nr:hypothetical protein [Kiritimatiellia bacterium]